MGEWVVTDRFFDVPLDHGDPRRADRIEVYAREVAPADGKRRPWLVFLQGGPGTPAPRPNGSLGWLSSAVTDFRVLLLDQRGTGRSTPANRQTLGGLGSPVGQAEYLTHFRADSIVRDCELIRRELLGPDGTWSVLGQSFGGFCATTYLSLAPEHLDRVLITGGLPSAAGDPDLVYRTTYPKVVERNEEYYRRYPGDERLLAELRDHVADTPARLPGGDLLGPERLRYLGLSLGSSTGYADLHYLLEQAWAGAGRLSETFLANVEQATSLTANPLFALLHEACHSEGRASNWSAARILAEFPALGAGGDRFTFTGEMIYPWMFDRYAVLRPLREAAEILARYQWPALYDFARLAANEVPVAAAIYHDDFYVPRETSIDTAGRIRGLRPWVTEDHEHDGLRVDGTVVWDHLLELVR